MSQPVTTNPFIIMLINMTVVFAVLIALGFVINLIHYIDPTKPSLLKFDLLGATFRGGMGDWTEILSAPVPAKEPSEGTPGF